MSDESTPNPRYFAKEGESVQVVYNLRDATPYADLGYEEVDEAAYLASPARARGPADCGW